MGRHLVATIMGLATGRSRVGEHRGHTDRVSGADPVRTFWDWVEVELERARRYEHDLVMLRFPVRGDAVLSEERCAGALRVTDRWCVSHGDLLVLAPETDRDGAEGLDRRLREMPRMELGAATVACFPSDALTGHGLQVTLGLASPRWGPFPDTSAARAS